MRPGVFYSWQRRKGLSGLLGIGTNSSGLPGDLMQEDESQLPVPVSCPSCYRAEPGWLIGLNTGGTIGG